MKKIDDEPFARVRPNVDDIDKCLKCNCTKFSFKYHGPEYLTDLERQIAYAFSEYIIVICAACGHKIRANPADYEDHSE